MVVTPGRLIAGLVALNAALIAVGIACVADDDRVAGRGIRVGLVFDVGGKNDKSFNEAAWRGLEAGARGARRRGHVHRAERGRRLRDRAALARGAAHGSRDRRRLHLRPGSRCIAPQFPEVKFAGIDYTPSANLAIPPNLEGLRFREQEGSFLVGAIAASLTQTKTVGFVGGMKIPPIRKFEAGYIAGVAYVCPECRVVSAYAGSEPSAFADPSLGAELAAAQYEQGADIIFHAAGKTGDGVFAAARQRVARARSASTRINSASRRAAW